MMKVRLACSSTMFLECLENVQLVEIFQGGLET